MLPSGCQHASRPFVLNLPPVASNPALEAMSSGLILFPCRAWVHQAAPARVLRLAGLNFAIRTCSERAIQHDYAWNFCLAGNKEAAQHVVGLIVLIEGSCLSEVAIAPTISSAFLFNGKRPMEKRRFGRWNGPRFIPSPIFL